MSIATDRGHRSDNAITIAAGVSESLPRQSASAADVLLVAAWFGMAAGLLELGFLYARIHLYRDTVFTFMTMSAPVGHHHVWTIPLSLLILFGVPGLVLALAAGIWRGSVGWPIVGILFGFLGSVSVLLPLPLHRSASTILALGLAVQGARWVGPHVENARSIIRRTTPVLAAVVLALVIVPVAGRALAERGRLASIPPPTASRPNVLLIVMDTVRSDHTSLVGYHRLTTPNLDRLARSGVSFDRAFATAPWTLPSHASMFTDNWPHQLNVGGNRPLDATEPTLAEFLASRGYVTAGFVANVGFAGSETGLARGFAHYEDSVATPRAILESSRLGRAVLQMTDRAGLTDGDRHTLHKSAATIHRDALRWLDSRRDDRPFFAFLNYYDAHTPYLPPDGFDRHFGLEPETRRDYRMLKSWWALERKHCLSPRDIALARDAYDECIASIDEQIGRLMAALEDRGVLHDTVVIVTSDHGELLGEHGLFGHAASLYLPEVHVPLLIRGPSVEARGRRVSEPVSLRDLPATIIDLLGLEPGSAPFPGRSLARCFDPNRSEADAGRVPLLTEVDPPPPLPWVSANAGRSPAFRAALRAILWGDIHYIRSGDGVEELYDLQDDPNETHDLAASTVARPVLDPFREALERIAGQSGNDRSTLGKAP